MEKTAEVSERARYRPVIQSQQMTRKFEKGNGKIEPICFPVPTMGAPAVSKVDNTLSKTVESRHFPNSEWRISLEIIVILKELQQQKWAF